MGRHSIPDPDDANAQSDAELGSTGRDEGAGNGDSEFRDFGYGPDGYGTDSDEPGASESDGYDADEPGFDGPEFDDRSFDDRSFDDRDEPTRAFAVPGTPGGPQHGSNWEGGEWTGSHRAITPGRRGVSRTVIFALIAVVALVGAVILWRFIGAALSDRSQIAADRCVEGEVTVAVVADPAIADQVTSMAEHYSKTADPVGDRCVQVAVTSADADAVINGFVNPWPENLGERPALWIPASSISEARLEAVTGTKTVSNSRSLVSTPVLLALRPALKPALANQNWSTLPALQRDPAGLDGLNLPGWGGLRLSLPLSGNSDAGYLAAEAVAAASAPAGAPPSAGSGAAQRLLADQPELADNRASTALDALINATDPATAPVHAVATTEQQLFQRAADLPDAGAKLGFWIPPGPTATADFPAALLNGDWLTKEQLSAASEFDRFMRKPEQLAALAEAGFRIEGVAAPESSVTDFAPLADPLSVGDPDSRATLATTLTAPAQDSVVTVILDQSMQLDEGGKSRLANVVSALNNRLPILPPSSAVGLWTFDGVAGQSVVSTGPLGDDVGGGPRSATLTAGLDAQTASGGGAVSFTTLRLVYGDAVANFRAGQPNSVLVITAGPHTDRTLDGQGLIDYVRGAVDPERPVAVNVVNFGEDPDRPTWEAIAEASGGEYRNLPSSTDPELAAAISTFLG